MISRVCSNSFFQIGRAKTGALSQPRGQIPSTPFVSPQKSRDYAPANNYLSKACHFPWKLTSGKATFLFNGQHGQGNLNKTEKTKTKTTKA